MAIIKRSGRLHQNTNFYLNVLLADHHWKILETGVILTRRNKPATVRISPQGRCFIRYMQQDIDLANAVFKKFNRGPLQGEVVHIDGDKTNNNILNLIIKES